MIEIFGGIFNIADTDFLRDLCKEISELIFYCSFEDACDNISSI
jgi:hypothetical protein